MAPVNPGPKAPARKSGELDTDCHARQALIQEAVRTFFRNVQVGSQNVTCFRCGSNSELKKATLSLFGTGETWELTLPLCEECTIDESGGGALPDRDTTEPDCRVMAEEHLQ